ncbi:MAG: tRNA pseudouridine(38-40) synthase TruA [Rhizobiales bacterium]|nr:tRNA pseudouridine(38-40) synthase TruA [Hyphomicrobiales bacterium]NRB14273.1 tRNA pseudouridine(38-40) synthase TruA [Hyphomicrobiales bacterium]
MYRYKLTIEYNGAAFFGWQIQDHGTTVQGQIEAALAKFTQQQPRVNGSGRTDSGVHALGQVAHFELTKQWPPAKIREALNFHLKPDAISILLVEAVDDQFDARFAAKQRHYIYRIINRRAPLAIDKGLAWHVQQPLDIKLMQQAAQYLVGHHDFTTFRSVHCQAKSPIKTVDKVEVTGDGEDIEIEVSARSFMHNQVRSFVGSLKNVGEGRWPPEQMQTALQACDRQQCGEVAPALGLYLVQIDY